MNTTKWVLLAIAALLITGCSTSPKSMKDIAADEAQASVIQANALEAQQKRTSEMMKDTLSQWPAWAMESPRPDVNGVYAVGMSESDVMRVALRKATLDAEFGLAKILHQEISGSERVYSQDSNGKVGNEKYVGLIDKLVSQVPVVGFEVVKQEVKPINGKYHAFILIKLPYAQFNRVLSEQRAKTEDVTIQKAFDDMETRLAKRLLQQQVDVRVATPVIQPKPGQPPVPSGSLPLPPPTLPGSGQVEINAH